jgi:hypothetical protein
MTSQGSAHGRFQRAIQRRNLFQAELSMCEMGTITLLEGLNYLDLLREVRPDKFERAAVLPPKLCLHRTGSVTSADPS